MKRLLSGRVDPQGVALLEDAPAVRLDGAGDRAGDRVERLAYDPKEGLIRLRTQSAGPRVLVVSENYQSNWSVWVDGAEAEMVRVNYVWKGVALSAGEHEVEFRYFSPVLAWARGAMLVGLVVGCGGGGGGLAAAATGWLTMDGVGDICRRPWKKASLWTVAQWTGLL